MAAEQIGEALPSGGEGGEATENYMRKRFREDLFKEENNNSQQGGDNSAGAGEPSSPSSSKSFKAAAAASQLPKHDVSAAAGGGLLRASNILPATAMWAVGPSSGAGSAFWMLPVTAGSGVSPAGVPTSGAGPSEQPPPPHMWTFPTPSPAASSTLQAPLHFMPRFNLPGGGGGGSGSIEFQGGGRSGSPLQLGSMLMQPPPSQQLGLGMSESNLGMLAALNAYSRGGLNMNSDHHHHQHQQQQNHPLDHHNQSQATTDSGDEDPNSSQ